MQALLTEETNDIIKNKCIGSKLFILSCFLIQIFSNVQIGFRTYVYLGSKKLSASNVLGSKIFIAAPHWS